LSSRALHKSTYIYLCVPKATDINSVRVRSQIRCEAQHYLSAAQRMCERTLKITIISTHNPVKGLFVSTSF